MYPVKHSSYHIGSVDEFIDVLLDYSEIDVEQTLLTNFMDQLNDYKIDRENDEEESPTEEEQIDYLECNYPISKLVQSVLNMVEDCKYRYLLDDNYSNCQLYVIDIVPASKEEFLDYIVNNYKNFTLTEKEITEAIVLKNL